MVNCLRPPPAFAAWEFPWDPDAVQPGVESYYLCAKEEQSCSLCLFKPLIQGDYWGCLWCLLSHPWEVSCLLLLLLALFKVCLFSYKSIQALVVWAACAVVVFQLPLAGSCSSLSCLFYSLFTLAGEVAPHLSLSVSRSFPKCFKWCWRTSCVPPSCRL